MPKSVTFDEDQVLHAAMKTFWHRGYVATSIKDLAKATGLTTGSIYNSFKDKDNLFAMALSHYVDHVVATRIGKYLEADDAREGLELYMEKSLRNAPSLGFDGCLIHNTMAEEQHVAPVARKILQSGRQRIDSALLKNISRAQKAGQIRTDITAETLKGRLRVILSGMMAHGQVDRSEEWADMIQTLLQEQLDG